jgi:hypothetical protein
MKNLFKTLLLIIALPVFLLLVIIGLPILIFILAVMLFLSGGKAFKWSNFDKMRQGYFNNGRGKNDGIDGKDQAVDIDCQVVEVNEESNGQDKHLQE